MRLYHFLILLLLGSCVQHSQDKIEKETLAIDPLETLDYLNGLEDSHQDDPSFYFQRAKAHQQLLENEKAYSDIKKAIDMKPSAMSYFLLKGKIEQRLNKPNDAIESLLIAEKLGSQDKKLFEILASEYLQIGEVEKAKASVDRLIDLRPDASSYSLRGDVLLAIGDSAQAIGNYKRALVANGSLKAVVEQLAEIYKAKGDNDAAGKVLNSYLAGNNDLELLLEKARLLSTVEDYDSAKHIYYQILSQDTSDYLVYYELSDIYYLQFKYDSAEYMAQKALDLNSKLHGAQLTLARVLDKRRRYQEAMSIYETILEQDSTNNLAAEELANLKRKVAYLWQLEQQQMAQDSARNNLPPTVEKKEIEN